ncbi:hypothetical protein ACFQ58_08920 [Agromyces sp. NPDC056523]|uniref:hypothetical protein n=1 Tax=Agromyces sp. NPDC056523 TaxID=3345850 RepID=UPI0036708DE0
MAVLIDPAVRPATTTWASALSTMNGGLFLVPVAALLVFGLLPQMEPSRLTTPVVLAVLGASLLFAARAAWRGAHWPRQYVLVVVAGEILGLALGYLYLGAALLFVAPAAWLLWRPSARTFAGSASQASVPSRRNPSR